MACANFRAIGLNRTTALPSSFFSSSFTLSLALAFNDFLLFLLLAEARPAGDAPPSEDDSKELLPKESSLTVFFCVYFLPPSK